MSKIRSVLARLTLAAALSAWSSGCSPSPLTLCTNLVDDICTRGTACLDPGVTAAECEAEVTKSLAGAGKSCTDAVSVTNDYGTCVTDIEDESCAQLFPPTGTFPSVCAGVILVTP